MSESDDEAWARLVVVAHLGVDLRFVDTDGRVDYEFTDPAGNSAALEVTTLTDSTLKRAVDGYLKSRGTYGPASTLSSCWSVCVHEREATFANLDVRLEPHLSALESADVAPMRWWSPAELAARPDEPELRPTAGQLTRAKVEMLLRWSPEECRKAFPGDPHEHRVVISRLGGFHAVSSDDALDRVEQFVEAGLDNRGKLVRSGADRKHLFVRLDHETDGAVTRPFGGPPVSSWDHFGLPSRPPRLPEEVVELWVVYEPTGEGWHWDGSQWEKVVAGR